MKWIRLSSYIGHNSTMKVSRQLFLTACVNLLLISQMVCQVVANRVGHENETRENLQKLFNSVVENDAERNEAFRQILTQEVVRDERSFDGMKEELRMKRSRNERTAKNVAAVKRETHTNIQDGESMQAKIEQIFRAAEENDFETVKVLIKRGVPANVTNEMGQTLAHIAVTIPERIENREMLRYVVKKDRGVLAMKDRNKKTVLSLAIEKKAWENLDYLTHFYRHESPVTDYLNFCSDVWQTAIDLGQMSIIDHVAVWVKCDVDYLGKYEKPPVFAAIEKRHPLIFRYLVRFLRANLTALDVHGSNILFEIVNVGDLDSMKFVLDERRTPLDLNARNAFGDTVLHRAVLLNHFDIVKYLVGDKSVLVNTVDGNNTTPLHLAANKGHDEIYEFLVEHGADVGLVDSEGKTPKQRREETKQVKSHEKSASRSRRSLPSPIPRSMQAL